MSLLAWEGWADCWEGWEEEATAPTPDTGRAPILGGIGTLAALLSHEGAKRKKKKIRKEEELFELGIL
jgi:hypothetical protein